MRRELIDRIDAERERQRDLGYDREHDKMQTAEQWRADLNTYMDKLIEADKAGNLLAVRARATQVAAIAIALLELADEHAPKPSSDDERHAR